MFRKLLFIIILKVFITQLDACVILLINRSEINTISETFECKSSQIYFEYSEGENILMECSKNDSNASTNSYLEFDGRIEWRENRIVKNITFSEMQNNTMVECGSREFRNDSFPNQQIDLGQIQVIFRMKMANTTNMLSNLMINPTGSSTIDLMSSLAITLDTSSSNETTIENSIIYPIDRLSTTVNTVPKISHAPYTETSTLSILFDTSVDSTSTNNLSVSLPTTPSTMVDEYRYSISNNLSDTSMNIFSERTDLSSKLVTISYETTTTFLSKVSPKTARVQSPVNFTSIVPLVPSNSSTTSVISTKSNSSTASISDTTLNRNLDNESVMLSLSNIPLSANVSHDSATTPEETSNSTSFTTTTIRRKEEQPSTVYPKFLGTNAPTPSSTFTSFAVSTLPDISDSTITSLPATTLASTKFTLNRNLDNESVMLSTGAGDFSPTTVHEEETYAVKSTTTQISDTTHFTTFTTSSIETFYSTITSNSSESLATNSSQNLSQNSIEEQSSTMSQTPLIPVADLTPLAILTLLNFTAKNILPSENARTTLNPNNVATSLNENSPITLTPISHELTTETITTIEKPLHPIMSTQADKKSSTPSISDTTLFSNIKSTKEIEKEPPTTLLDTMQFMTLDSLTAVPILTTESQTSTLGTTSLSSPNFLTNFTINATTLSNIPLSANVFHDSATTPEETSNSTSFTTTSIRRKEEQPSTVYPKFLGTNAPTPSSTFTSFAVSTLPDISDSTITSLPATTLASTLANLFSTTTDINTRIETPILLPIRRTISATTDLPKLITSKRTDIIKLVSPGMENITKPVVGSSKNKLPYHKALLVVFVLIFMVLACSFVAIYRMVKQNSHKRVSSNDDVDPEIPPFPAQWYNDYVIYENGSDNNSFLTTSGKEFQEELYTKPLPKTQRVKNKDESMYANLNVSRRSQNEVLQMETMYSNISPETQRQNNPDWIYSNQETSINEPPKDVYAQIKPKRYRKQPIYANNPNHMEFVRSETFQPTERPS